MMLQSGLRSLALMLCLSSACTTVGPVSVFNKFDELEMSRAFSSQTIASKPFVAHVIGLDRTKATDAFLPTSQQASQLLTDQLQSHRSDLTIEFPALATKDETKLASILKQFGENQEFPAEGYHFLQKQPWHNSWLLIADLERDLAEQDLVEDEIKDSKGKVFDTKYTYITSRQLDVRYFIYDIDTKQLVFMGLIRSTTDARHERIGSGRDTGYPEIPSLQKSLNQNFQRFARSLPSTQGH